MTLPPRPRLVIADDHHLILDAFQYLIGGMATVVGSAADGEELIRVVEATRPDLVVTDLSMGRRNGIEATCVIRTLPHPPRVIILTIHADPAIARAAFEAGASGFVLKSADTRELQFAIATVMHGSQYCSPAISNHDVATQKAGPLAILTDREREILTLIANGCTGKEISARLGIAERTVNFHKKNLKGRLGVATIAEAVAWLSRQSPQGV